MSTTESSAAPISLVYEGIDILKLGDRHFMSLGSKKSKAMLQFVLETCRAFNEGRQNQDLQPFAEPTSPYEDITTDVTDNSAFQLQISNPFEELPEEPEPMLEHKIQQSNNRTFSYLTLTDSSSANTEVLRMMMMKTKRTPKFPKKMTKDEGTTLKRPASTWDGLLFKDYMGKKAKLLEMELEKMIFGELPRGQSAMRD